MTSKALWIVLLVLILGIFIVSEKKDKIEKLNIALELQKERKEPKERKIYLF